jgi:cyclophilin family peptidyl-prolyl cis-trans isomerase
LKRVNLGRVVKYLRRLLMLAAFLCLAIGCVAEPEKDPVVVIETSEGTIQVELYPEKAPETVKNFLSYVDDHAYDGTIFHRVIPDFMIQGGGFEPGMTERKTKPPIKNEAGNGLTNARRTIAMARTNDPNSATSQFFINVADNRAKLDKTEQNAGYCVFGRVIEGMDVADKIRQVETHTVGPHGDVPVKDVIIKSIHRAK